ncbi:hypothetical protein AMEX_G18057 [Astyanax mexicanus]|uniref:Immunoglobulin subtype domain-containing protein n=1 Tax=Astyanax mexicanus TaxID=7994 RepID=A0A8T2LB79_ASTMX|nr:hypothetical protein AMEX_G18057 [Astyanax mexicanus]
MFTCSSRTTKAMLRVCLLHCLLVQSFHTVFCFSTGSTLRCPDVNGTVGEPIILNCTLKCERRDIKKHKWKFIVDSDWTNINDSQSESEETDGSFIFQYELIPAKHHNTTFQFWVQLTTGTPSQNFTVRLSEKIPSNVTTGKEKSTDEFADPHQGTEMIPPDSSATHKHTGIFVAVAAALGLIVLAVLSKKTPDRVSLHYIV